MFYIVKRNNGEIVVASLSYIITKVTLNPHCS